MGRYHSVAEEIRTSLSNGSVLVRHRTIAADACPPCRGADPAAPLATAAELKVAPGHWNVRGGWNQGQCTGTSLLRRSAGERLRQTGEGAARRQIRTVPRPPSRRWTINLPHDMAEVVEDKIKSGHYASVSVVRDGVRALLERDAAVERWLREEVVAGHQEYQADPSNGVPVEASSNASRRVALPARRGETLCRSASRHLPSATSTDCTST